MPIGKYIRTEKIKNSLSVSAKRAYENGRKKGFPKGHKINTGRKLSEAQKAIIGKRFKGKKLPQSHILKAVNTRIRKGSYVGRKGEKSNLWKGGISSINEIIRKSKEYILWRKSVFERDNYTCIWCGVKNGKGKTIELHPDHIKPFAYFPELRFAIDNGRTLCIDCHRKTDTFGGGAKKYEIHS